jgi:hypothetical protein
MRSAERGAWRAAQWKEWEMRSVKVENAEPGDVLAEPLTNPKGQVLLPAGARLSAAVLSRCRGWGVESLQVEGEDASAEAKNELVDALEFRFAELEDDALMLQIKAIARGHLLKSQG